MLLYVFIRPVNDTHYVSTESRQHGESNGNEARKEPAKRCRRTSMPTARSANLAGATTVDAREHVETH